MRGEIKPIKPLYEKHSGILINDELLLDMGEDEFLKYKPKWILITHLHPDHAIFVREKIIINNKNIFGPEKSENAKIKVKKKKFKIGKYTITPIPIHHSKIVKSLAYIIETKDRSILYTGDILKIDKKYYQLFNDLDLVITEGSFFKKDGKFGHNGIPNLIHLFKKFSKKILLVHFGRWFLDNIEDGTEKINELAKKEKVNVLIGYEGMQIII